MRFKIPLIVKILLGLMIAYALYFFMYAIILDNRVDRITNKKMFSLSSILPISEDRISYQASYTNDHVFLGFDCLIDSAYCVSVIKVGQLTTSLKELIHLEEIPHPIRNHWFSYDYDIVSTEPNFDELYAIFFNTRLLPLNSIARLDMHLDGNVLSETMINNNILEYQLESTKIRLSFNDLNRYDLSYLFMGYLEDRDESVKVRKQKADAGIVFSLLFCVDASRNLYVVNIAPRKNKAPKTLRELMEK